MQQQSIDISLKKIDASGKILLRTIIDDLYPLLKKIELNKKIEWSSILTHFLSLSKQFDTVYQDMEPLFSFTIPIPILIWKEQSIPIPILLQSSIPVEDSSALEIPSDYYISEYNNLLDNEKQNIIDVLFEHNECIDELIINLNLKINDWKINQANISKKLSKNKSILRSRPYKNISNSRKELIRKKLR